MCRSQSYHVVGYLLPLTIMVIPPFVITTILLRVSVSIINYTVQNIKWVILVISNLYVVVSVIF